MPPLPSGTVTLLFTDIEGSTRLLGQLGEAYGQVLHDLRRLHRAVFDSAGGREVDTQGDAFLVAFARAGDAVAAAAALQQAVAGHAWPAGADVRVRAGVHTGEPTATGTGYVGMDVHVGARICGAAHGGEVLLSRATRDLLDPGVAVRELGDHRLRDIPEPTRLFRLLVPGLRNDFPPPRSLSVTNLPRPATPLVGRARELEDVRALLRLDGVRLLTLTGAGGAGKTRLALEAALGLLDDFDHGVFLVSLAALDRAEEVVPEIARTVGARERPGEPLLDTLAAELADRRLLLVLDNLERLVAAAPAVATLLGACPRLTVLATSRERLHLLAEREYPLPPLRDADAVELFERRAVAAAPSFTLTEERRPDVEAICRRLDGLPLAIELAAPYVRVLPPGTILEKLEQRLAFLTGGARDLPERQRTLRATIDWSHGLLRPEESELFARLAVFAGGFSVEAAQAVLAADADVLPLLTSLRDKHLIASRQSADERPRFLLLDTIREYALERLRESPAAEAAHRLHAEHFAAAAELAEPELTGSEQALWLQRLEEERENLEAALAWASTARADDLVVRLAGALWRFWFLRGHLSAGGRWLGEAVRVSRDAEPARRARVLFGASTLSALQGDLERARTLADERLELCRGLGDAQGTISALVALANVVSDSGDLEPAVALYEEAAGLARETGATAALAGTTTNLAYLALRRGEWERAQGLAEEAAGLFRGVGHAAGTADSLLNLAFAAERRGRPRQALGSLADGLRIYAELGHREGVANALEGLAAAAAGLGDGERAGVLVGAAEALRASVGALLEPYELELHEATLGALRAQLSEDELAARQRHGAELDLGDAVALGVAVAAHLSGTASDARVPAS